MTTVASFGEAHFGKADLKHKRRTNCLVRIADRIYRHPGGTLPVKLHDPKDYKAMDRLMNRPEVTHAAVLETHRQKTLERMRQSKGTQDVVLVLHDTTELDYSGLRSITDLGPIGGGLNRGFLCHNSLAFDPQRHEVIGLANQILHRRRHVGRKEGVKKKRERADRESLLWTKGVAAVGQAPPDANWIHVADRGADTFEFLAWHMDQGFVVRSNRSRVIRRGHNCDGVKDDLHSHIRAQKLHGRREVVVSARPGQPERKATVGVAFAPVQILPPHVRRGHYVKRPLPLWVVRVCEIDPPKGVKPLEWILITNRKVATVEDAEQRASWYECRWVIEEYHKAQKTGCAIEDLQFTTSQSLEPMIALLSVVAVTLLNLREASRRRDAHDRPATDLVDASYVAVLSAWRYKKIRKDLSIHDFFYALARLGGHQNRKRDHRPGWLVLWRGWMALQQMVDGAEALKSCG
jgi:hypothetical protein